jgi:hypothetical protein
LGWLQHARPGNSGAEGSDIVADDPFWETEFMILEFDPRTAGVSVHNSESEGVQYSGYGSRNRAEAVRDATTAATSAQERGLPLRYVVVKIATEEVFPE